VNEIKIVVTGTDKSGPALAAAEKEAKALTTAVEKIPGVTPALTGLGHEADKAGDKLSDAAAAARRLDAELEVTRAEVKRLADEFARTGDQDLMAKFNKQAAYLAQLERLAKKTTRNVADDAEKTVTDAGENAAAAAAKAGVKAGEKLALSFGQRLAKSGAEAGEKLGLSMGEAAGAALLVALPIVVEAASIVGVMAGGAILTGVGLAGIGSGLAAELKDPEIQAAVARLSSTVKATAAGAAQPMIGPLEKGLDGLTAKVGKLGPSLHKMYSDLAPHTDILFGGLEKSIDRVVPAFEKMVTASEPLIDELGYQLPRAAGFLADMMGTIADHSDEAVEGLDLLFGALDAGIKSIDVATSAFSALYDASKTTTGGLALLIDSIGDTGKHGQLLTMSTDEAGKSAEELAAEQKALATALDAATAAFERQINDMLAADNSAINYQQAIDDLSQSVHDNGRSLDINSQAGRNNRRVIDQLIGTIEANYEANIKAGMGADKAGLAFAQQVGDLKKQMTQLHFSKDAINEYIRALEAMRLAAISANNAINDTGVNHTHHDFGATGGLALGGSIKHFAAGGLATTPTFGYAEPETGGEWLIPNRGISRGRAAMLLSGAGRGYGLDVVGAGGGRGGGAVAVAAPPAAMSAEVRTTVDFSGDVDSAVATMFMRLVRERKIRILSSAVVAGS
jgi:hypothetical protein